MNGCSGIVTRAAANDPTAHITAESRHSSTPAVDVARPRPEQHGHADEPDPDSGQGCAAHLLPGGEPQQHDQQRHRRDDQRRDADRRIPLGEEEHRVRARQQAADHDAPAELAAPDPHVPPRHSTIPAISAPAKMNRVETARSGGIVSPATAIPRYVEPQMM